MSEAQCSLEEKLKALRDLEEIVERLRAPDGCPWDRAQTLTSMAPNLLEEACEAVDAIGDGGGAPTAEVCEELGDLLMNVLLISRIAEDRGGFGLRDVAERIAAKLIRRHPHVFGDGRAASVEEVLSRWEAIKAEEKGGAPPSRLGRIPRSLPALAAALKVGEKAAAVGFDWPDAAGAFGKVEEELREVAEALRREGPRAPGTAAAAELRHEIGDLLFAVANLARKSGVEPEAALREALGRFRRRFEYIESRTDMTSATPETMEALWKEAKTDGF